MRQRAARGEGLTHPPSPQPPGFQSWTNPTGSANKCSGHAAMTTKQDGTEREARQSGS